MQKLILLFCVFIFSYCNSSKNPGQQLLEKTIAYHDPQNNWPKLKTHLYLSSTDTAGKESLFELEMDNTNGYFCHISHEDGKEIVKGMADGKEFYLINGKREISEEERKKYELNPEGVKWVHSFYGYLYGLPMKLADKGVNVGDTVRKEEVNGKTFQTIHVTYDPAIGTDNWFFYVDNETSAMKAYKFNHGEPGSGEYILLDQELIVDGIKIPKVRKWYLNKDNSYLGTDNLLKAEKLNAHRI
jgi:ribosomal protein L24E